MKWKLDSIRWRSVAFGEWAAAGGAPEDQKAGEDQEEVEGEDGGKKYLTINQKKRIAFYKGELNTNAEVTNAYVVFGHVAPATDDQTNTHPAEVSRMVIETMNDSVFEGNTVRVDRVGRATVTVEKDKSVLKRTIFVGNLTFEATEEDVRAFFESLVEAERGEVDEEITPHKRGLKGAEKEGWVQSVRIVRDRESQLGKGIAYVVFRVSSMHQTVLSYHGTHSMNELRMSNVWTKCSRSHPRSSGSDVAPSGFSDARRLLRPPKVQIA